MSLLLRFNQLRSSTWSSCPARLLMQHTGLSSGKLLDPKRYEKCLFSKRVQETSSSHTTGLGSCISGSQPFKFQQTSEHEQTGPLLIFDIETTGFSWKYNRITEFAVRDLCGGKNSTFETLLNPEMNAPGYLKTVNDITTELVCRPDVPRFSDVLPLLLAFVRSRQTPGKPVIWVAHKAKTFDACFLAQEFDRCSAEMPEDWLFVDSLCLARKLPKLPASEDKSHLLGLKSLSKRYKISVEGCAHRAMQDVTTLCHVFQKMSFDLKLTYEGLVNEATKASDFRQFVKFSDVLPLLLAFVRSRQTPGKPVIWVAHKAKTFDACFLAQEFDRCSAEMPEDWLFVDSLCLARKLPKLPASEDKSHLLGLKSLSKRYKISVEGCAHRAMQDVTTLCHVFQKMSFDLKLTYEGLVNEATKASDFRQFVK